VFVELRVPNPHGSALIGVAGTGPQDNSIRVREKNYSS